MLATSAPGTAIIALDTAAPLTAFPSSFIQQPMSHAHVHSSIAKHLQLAAQLNLNHSDTFIESISCNPGPTVLLCAVTRSATQPSVVKLDSVSSATSRFSLHRHRHRSRAAAVHNGWLLTSPDLSFPFSWWRSSSVSARHLIVKLAWNLELFASILFPYSFCVNKM